MDILKRISEQAQEESELTWEGTFADYLKIVEERPWVADSAHIRLYNMIKDAGIEVVNNRKQYNFFKDKLFGLDDSLQRIIEQYLHPAAKRLDVRKRILLLMGPVSGGKSTFVTLLKRGLEQYSRTDRGAIYSIKGCPMNEDPLKLIPENLRDDFYKQYGVKIEGSLSPLNRLRLEEEYDGKIENVLVERVFFSEDKRVGIGTFSPSDPKSQDIAELTGSIDFSTIATYGSESDPRAYRFDGELNIANRGLMEFQEMLKCDEKFLWHLLSLTEEGNFKAGRFALISADEVIIAHTNEAEYRSFIANKKNEALNSRIIVMPMPYNLSISAEEKIYEKMIKNSDVADVHLAPHSLKVAAMFSILTRLKEPKRSNLSILEKMYLYDSNSAERDKATIVQQLKSEYNDEGMDGLDPRFIINIISATIIKKNMEVINALDILLALKEGIEQHLTLSTKLREKYLNYISLVRKEYDEIAKKEVQKAFIFSYEQSADALMDNYLDNIEAFCNRNTILDPLTGEEINADENLMRSIEEQIGISENAKRPFREEILIKISALSRKGERFNYKSHDRLREAIERKLFSDLKDLVKITSLAQAENKQQVQKVNEVLNRLIENYHYNEKSANDLLRYVGSLITR